MGSLQDIMHKFLIKGLAELSYDVSGVRSHNLLNKTSNKSSVEIIKNAVDLAESLCIVYSVYCILPLPSS